MPRCQPLTSMQLNTTGAQAYKLSLHASKLVKIANVVFSPVLHRAVVLKCMLMEPKKKKKVLNVNIDLMPLYSSFSLFHLSLQVLSFELFEMLVQTSFWQYTLRTLSIISSLLSHFMSPLGTVFSMIWALSPFIWRSAVICNNQVGQLDPLRVLIVVELKGGKLVKRTICCY